VYGVVIKNFDLHDNSNAEYVSVNATVCSGGDNSCVDDNNCIAMSEQAWLATQEHLR